MRTQILILAVGFSLFLVGCSGTTTQAPTATTAPVTITLITDPMPAEVGDVELVFNVVDDNGKPVSGADFDVFADHTDMSGMTMHGKASDQGNGNYSINTNFSMSGKWKLSLQVHSASLDFKQDIDLLIK